MNKILSTLLLIVVFWSCQVPDESGSKRYVSGISDSLTLELQNIYQQGFINGFSVVIVDSSGIIYQNGFGYADKNPERDFTENTLLNIGSVTKTIVGLSLLKAQELQLLSLDDPINNHLPFTVENPFFPNEPITIRQLANHTSTITDSDYFHETCYVMLDQPDTSHASAISIPDFFNSPEDTTSLASYMEQMLSKEGDAFAKTTFLKAKPGDQFQYSNTFKLLIG